MCCAGKLSTRCGAGSRLWRSGPRRVSFLIDHGFVFYPGAVRSKRTFLSPWVTRRVLKIISEFLYFESMLNDVLWQIMTDIDHYCDQSGLSRCEALGIRSIHPRCVEGVFSDVHIQNPA